jgi:hypothetical protein
MGTQTPISGDQEAIRPIAIQGQIIVGALLAGLLCFLVITTVIDVGPKPAGAPGAAAVEPPMPIITYLAVASGAMLLPVSFVVPVLVSKKQRQAMLSGQASDGPRPATAPCVRSWGANTPIGGFPAAFLIQLIMGCAISEGAAFFALVAYLLEKNPLSLTMALVLIAAIIMRFPTSGRVGRWIEQQEEKLRGEQLDASSSR